MIQYAPFKNKAQLSMLGKEVPPNRKFASILHDSSHQLKTAQLGKMDDCDTIQVTPILYFRSEHELYQLILGITQHFFIFLFNPESNSHKDRLNG